MKQVNFEAYCPFELGDKVKLTNTVMVESLDIENKFIIDDIWAIHSLKDGSVVFDTILINTNGNKFKAKVESLILIK